MQRVLTLSPLAVLVEELIKAPAIKVKVSLVKVMMVVVALEVVVALVAVVKVVLEVKTH